MQLFCMSVHWRKIGRCHSEVYFRLVTSSPYRSKKQGIMSPLL